MIRIKARHIQIDSIELAGLVMDQWQQGADFQTLARAYSQCPTAQHGGSLGEFGPGQMAPEIEAVAFQGDVGAVYGPIASQRGYHLLEILERNEYR